MTLLRSRPELAGALAGAADPDDSARLIDSLGAAGGVVPALLLAAPDPALRPALLNVAGRHGRLVDRLSQAGAVGCETLSPQIPGAGAERPQGGKPHAPAARPAGAH